MFKLCTDYNLSSLADSLLMELQDQPSQNPLQPETIVVQNYGMARWLSLFIAEKEGVAANFAFKFPAEVYWQIMRVMDPGIPENLPSERGPMSWAIFQILLQNDDPALSKLHQYVESKDPQKQEMRCWNLASRIGDVFDQYLTYRPAMLRRWEDQNNNELATDFSSEQWQAHLWQKLSKRWKQQGEKNRNHRAQLEKTLTKKIDNGCIPAEDLPQRITTFGVSEMPEVYIKTFVKLSKLTDIHFYVVDGVKNERNTLVRSLGKVGIEHKSLIKKHLRAEEELKNVQINNLKTTHSELTNFFELVKHDLIRGNKAEKKVLPDRSVQIHSCHSPRREVEVLYDQLLRMLDENENLNPSDIMVFCPQMEDYGPEIAAIFGAVEEGMPQIPYHLAETAAESNAVDLSFQKLLHLVDSRFKVTDMLDLLDCKPVRQNFSFTDDDANKLEKWIGDNRIHWGISCEQKQALGLPNSNSFTWQSGLNRMMTGYAMRPADDELFQQIYPYDEIQQTEDAQLLGRFSRFLNQLFICHQQIKNPKTLDQWAEVLNEWVSTLFPDGENYFGDLQKLHEVIRSLHEQQQLAEMETAVSFRVIRAHLEDKLEQEGTGGGRPGRGVIFSGMVPMRNIPAKVICMIGMNDGIFPRPKNSVAFNLITKDPREGDRLAGKEDRQIFLENILAARHQIYFSYVGQGNKKEAEYPPSVILREFLEYLVKQYDINEDNIIQQHRLQSFSPYYFKQNNGERLFSYSPKGRDIAVRLAKDSSAEKSFLIKNLPEPEASFKKLSVGEFISFFQHPAKFLLQERLGIFLYEDQLLDEDRELFELGGLEKYQIGQEMLKRYLDDQSSLHSYKNIALAKDLLPEGGAGAQAFEAQAREVKEFGNEISKELDQQQLDPVEVDMEIGAFKIVGRLDQIYENHQLLFRFGRMRPKDLIELWIRHLLLQRAKLPDHPEQSRLYTRHKRKPLAVFQLDSTANAADVLHDLLEIYWAGLRRNTLFYPNSSFAFAEKVIYKNKDVEEGLKAADREWVDRYRGYPKEGDDPYIKRISGEANPFEDKYIQDKFKQITLSFWEPFFSVMNKMEAG